jgi:hypothetical protein
VSDRSTRSKARRISVAPSASSPAGISAALACTAVLVLTGCTSGGDDTDAQPAYTAPAWFAEQAQEREEYRTALQSCLDGKGWKVTVNRDGGIDESFQGDEIERIHVDVDTCRVSMGFPASDDLPPQDEASLRRQYAMLVDTATCLRAQGVDVADPPSEDTWVDTSLQGTDEQKQHQWHPYDDPAWAKVPEDRVAELERTCPQPWATR